MYTSLKKRMIGSGLRAMAASGLDRLFPSAHQGAGVIFMLHRVSPELQPSSAFAPNRHLSITPDFLRSVIALVRARGMDIVSLDEARSRLLTPNPSRFAVFTLDDGYRDNAECAYPVFKAADAPFTIYVPSTWPSGTGSLWWRTLEDVVRAAPSISLTTGGSRRDFATSTVAEKDSAFEQLRQILHDMDLETMRQTIRELAERHGIDANAPCAQEIMSWDEIRDLSRDGLVTIGSHSRTHASLAKLADGDLDYDLAASRAELEHAMGRPCLHLAYPYGNNQAAGPREYQSAARAGYHTAVTGNRGLVFGSHSTRLTALPRIPLEGDLQDIRLIEVQLSGMPFVWGGPFASSKS